MPKITRFPVGRSPGIGSTWPWHSTCLRSGLVPHLLHRHGIGARLLFWVATLLVALAIAPALAKEGFAAGRPQSTRTAKRLFARAREHFKRGHFARAQRLLRRARASTADARLSAQVELYLGLAAAARRGNAAARPHFRAAVRLDPAVDLDPRRFKPGLVRLLRRVRDRATGQLQITADRQGLRLRIDGVSRGPLPFRGRLPAGAHRLRLVTAEGKTVYRARIDLRPGGRGRIHALTLPARAGSAAAAKGRPAPARAVGTQRPAAESPARRSKGGGYLWTWIGAGLTAAALATAGGFGISALIHRSKGCDLMVGEQPGCSDSGDPYVMPEDYARYRELQLTVEHHRLISNILWGVGGLFGIATAVAFWLEHRAASSGSETKRARAISDAVVAGPGRVAVRVRF